MAVLSICVIKKLLFFVFLINFVNSYSKSNKGLQTRKGWLELDQERQPVIKKMF